MCTWFRSSFNIFTFLCILRRVQGPIEIIYQLNASKQKKTGKTQYYYIIILWIINKWHKNLNVIECDYYFAICLRQNRISIVWLNSVSVTKSGNIFEFHFLTCVYGMQSLSRNISCYFLDANSNETIKSDVNIENIEMKTHGDVAHWSAWSMKLLFSNIFSVLDTFLFCDHVDGTSITIEQENSLQCWPF